MLQKGQVHALEAGPEFQNPAYLRGGKRCREISDALGEWIFRSRRCESSPKKKEKGEGGSVPIFS